ncbi:hypothetical protein [Amycolatopsis australiensis]|uniref:hypothetical protein n=1 Tax=Amycolatopsis australiensis TaxID=546364 RepID=UPI0009307DD9|nr:hypothetical protein [Amycolatopsis australiensis]
MSASPTLAWQKSEGGFCPALPEWATAGKPLLSANRDERRYDRADQLDIHRNETSLAFGHGILYCLGAQLGAMEAEIVLGALTRRFPDARLIDKAGLRRRQPAMIPNSYVDLPVYLG